jgi:hypothetical protein
MLGNGLQPIPNIRYGNNTTGKGGFQGLYTITDPNTAEFSEAIMQPHIKKGAIHRQEYTNVLQIRIFNTILRIF